MEEEQNSRLFAIDAGLSLSELRANYSDRNHYAIVRAQVRPQSFGGQGKVMGYIDHVSANEINVPYEYHSVFEAGTRHMPGRTAARQTFEASVAFGQRLEPWLMGIAVEEK